MKLQRIKDIVTGAVIATLVVGTASTAFAKAANMNIPVQYDNIKVTVNGEQLLTSKEPFIYDGTTYLPLRAVAEAVGMEVSWDSTTKTASLESKETEQKPVPQESNDESAEQIHSSRFDKILSKNTISNHSGVKVSCIGVKDVDDYFGGIEIELKGENTSSKNYSVTLDDIIINGKTMSAVMYMELNNERSAKDTIRIYEKDLKDANIENLYTISMKFHITNTDNYDYTTSKEMLVQFR